MVFSRKGSITGFNHHDDTDEFSIFWEVEKSEYRFYHINQGQYDFHSEALQYPITYLVLSWCLVSFGLLDVVWRISGASCLLILLTCLSTNSSWSSTFSSIWLSRHSSSKQSAKVSAFSWLVYTNTITLWSGDWSLIYVSSTTQRFQKPRSCGFSCAK